MVNHLLLTVMDPVDMTFVKIVTLYVTNVSPICVSLLSHL